MAKKNIQRWMTKKLNFIVEKLDSIKSSLKSELIYAVILEVFIVYLIVLVNPFNSYISIYPAISLVFLLLAGFVLILSKNTNSIVGRY